MIHQETYKGYTIKISQDLYPINPRTDYEPLGTIYGKWGESDFSDIEQNNNWEDTKEYLNSHYIWLPVYGYSHGGKSVKTSPFNCQWDSGLMGVIAVLKDKARKEYGRLTKKQVSQIESYLEGEIETFDHYLTGEVWGYEVEDRNSEDVLHSCWGYYGDYDNKEYSALTAAREMVDYQIKVSIIKHIKAIKQQIINKVPLRYRIQLSI